MPAVFDETLFRRELRIAVIPGCWQDLLRQNWR